MIIAIPVSTSPGKRPAAVWAILALYAAGLTLAAAFFFAVYSGALRLPPREAAFYANFGFLNFLGLALGALLGIVSMIQLFRMRRSAAYFVTAGFLVTFAKQIWYLPKFMSMGYSPVTRILSILLGIWIVWYVWHLRRAGTLK
jgi:hypothetical protein